MSFIQISKENFFHNLSIIENKVGNKDKIAVVIKDNAYGHDIELISKLSKEYGIKKAIVRDVSEANQVLEYFDEIISLNSCDNIVSDKISQVINDILQINDIKSGSRVELKIDTGMHRNGIMPCELEQSLRKIQEKNLILNGVMTHFASADMLNNSLFLQVRAFEDIKQKVKDFCNKENIKIPFFHSCNSSACFRLNDVQDFVRVGISIYGYVYVADGIEQPNLKPVMSLWANKISSRFLEKNERVGYGNEGIVKQDIQVSTYDIGYGDGFFRINNQEYVMPNNAKVLGRVSMDNFCATCDDEVICVFDDVSKIADIFNTINYDILVKLNKNIKKIVV